jgi:hypothetical protein
MLSVKRDAHTPATTIAIVAAMPNADLEPSHSTQLGIPKKLLIRLQTTRSSDGFGFDLDLRTVSPLKFKEANARKAVSYCMDIK